jgi:hypothetical protein
MEWNPEKPKMVAYADRGAIVVSDNISPLVCDVGAGSDRRFERWCFWINAARDARVENIVQCLPYKVVPIFERPFDPFGTDELVQSGVTSGESLQLLKQGLQVRRICEQD